ncbi:MAG TPA: short-chain dehydrogenase [Gemmatimonadota bacterium]|nr:short-chain dehydrogenase [Gemmatimonadota bacterium]
MELENTKVLILGGWGLVGSAIARALVEERPAEIVVHSLRESEAAAAVEELRSEFTDGPTRFSPAWGNLFVRESLKDRARGELLASSASRRALIHDTMAEISVEMLEESALYRLLADRAPTAVVDCVNTATAFAYQDVYYSVRRVQESMGWFDAGEADPDALSGAVESLLTTLALPQLVRHVQILREGLRAGGTRAYLKIGTTGTGGMGLNIPYTHSEERPSRVLLSKSSIAGAHSMLLYLLARTPGGPVVKEIKPSAAIAWKRIGAGPVLKGGRPIRLYDCPPEEAVTVEAALSGDVRGWSPVQGVGGEPAVLESVWVDTGENGMFATEEFETVTALGQMEYVTPEEIAANVVLELRGGTTGREVVSALDGATMGPTYRAGVMRHRALERMRALERDHEHESVAFEMLGPPHLSKLLYEAHLLRRTRGTLRELAECDPAGTSAECARLVADDAALRARILSIGLAIRLPDGRILRGPELKIPPYKDEALSGMDAAAVERWADAGWVDLAPANFERWAGRARAILHALETHPVDDTSSRLLEDRDYWDPDGSIRPGRVAAWILGVEERGARGKSQ